MKDSIKNAMKMESRWYLLEFATSDTKDRRVRHEKSIGSRRRRTGTCDPVEVKQGKRSTGAFLRTWESESLSATCADQSGRR